MDPHVHNICEPRLVKSLDGTEICADAAGNRAPKCPVIVLIHGFSVRKEAFDPMFEDPKWVQNAFLVSEMKVQLIKANSIYACYLVT